MEDTLPDKFIKDICRTVGHERDRVMAPCTRCGCYPSVNVYVNGVLQQLGHDYVEQHHAGEMRIVFTNHTAETIQLAIGYLGAGDGLYRVAYQVNAYTSVSLNLPV